MTKKAIPLTHKLSLSPPNCTGIAKKFWEKIKENHQKVWLKFSKRNEIIFSSEQKWQNMITQQNRPYSQTAVPKSHTDSLAQTETHTQGLGSQVIFASLSIFSMNTNLVEKKSKTIKKKILYSQSLNKLLPELRTKP